jgi:hypothetical protein
MLFLSYWELNENLTPKDIVEVAAELMEKKLWPVEGTKMLGWYTTTDVPIWGFTIMEAKNVEQVLKGIAIWTNAKPGFFKVVKTSPGMTAEEAVRVIMEM